MEELQEGLHPISGKQKKSWEQSVRLGAPPKPDVWQYSDEKTIKQQGRGKQFLPSYFFFFFFF